MTIVLVISSKNNDEINAYSDSRISDKNPLLDGVAKLLPLSVRVFDVNNKVIFSNSFGFAFAGSSLVAQTVYSFASASLQALRTDTGNEIPSLEEVSKFIAFVLKNTAKEMGSKVIPATRVQTSLFIFGYCPVEKARKLFKAETQISPTFEILFAELNVAEEATCHCIGDQIAIDMLIAKQSSTGTVDYPTELNNLIKSSDAPMVGGDLQAMIANELGASITPILHKTEGHPDKWNLLNQDFSDITVGPCHFKHKAIEFV